MIVDLTLEVDDDQDPDCHNEPGQLCVIIEWNLVKALDVIIFHKGNVPLNFPPIP